MLPHGRLLAITMPSRVTTAISSYPGLVWLPRIFVSDLAIESSFRKIQIDLKASLYRRSAGTLCLAPLWLTMGRPDFFKLPIPTEEEEWGDGIPNEAVNLFAWSEFISRESLEYHVMKHDIPKDPSLIYSRGRPKPSSYPEKTNEVLATEMEEMTKNLLSATEQVSESVTESESIIEMASDCEDLNRAVLFGPNWPFKILFILLLYKRKAAAQSFIEFLDQLRWWQLFDIDKTAGQQRMKQLFSFFDSGPELICGGREYTTEIPIELERLQQLMETSKNTSNFDDRINYRVNYTAIAMRGIGYDPDTDLLKKYL